MPLCKNPYMAGNMPCPCGKCMPCLINRKRLWTHRILLESYGHEHSSFITLTYSDDNLYYNNSLHPTLNPKHLQNFLKRIRRASDPTKLRFYGVGEYGDKSWRPHYHLALFGYEPCYRPTGTRKDLLAKGQSCCPPCDLIQEKWSIGRGKNKRYIGGIDNAKVENQSAGYIAGYVTKKLTKSDDPKLQGRHPEFSRMSKTPGIGAIEIEKIAIALQSQFGQSMLTEHGDVPVSLNHGARSLPLGRYLRDKIRDLMDFEEVYDIHTGELKYAPKVKATEEYKTEMLSMWLSSLKDEDIHPKNKVTLKHLIQHQDKQKIINLEQRTKLRQKEKKL